MKTNRFKKTIVVTMMLLLSIITKVNAVAFGNGNSGVCGGPNRDIPIGVWARYSLSQPATLQSVTNSYVRWTYGNGAASWGSHTLSATAILKGGASTIGLSLDAAISYKTSSLLSAKTYVASDSGSATLRPSVRWDYEGPAPGNYRIDGLVNGYAGPASSVSVYWPGKDVGCARCANCDQSIDYPASQKSASMRLMDNVGNFAPVQWATWKYDSTPPSCSANLSTYEWTAGPVTVTGSCSDTESGFAGCSTATIYSEFGTGTITCRDNVGNSRSYSKQATKIDTTNPTCGAVSYTSPGAGNYVRTAIPVTVGCSDPLSNGSEGSRCTAPSYTANISGGSGTITISDNVGHSTGCGVSYGFWDGSGPNVTISFDSAHSGNSANQYTRDDRITVTISATDDRAGVDRVCYSLSGATSQGEKCTKGSSVSFDISNEGITNITGWAYDKAYDYNGGYTYAGGNRSANATKSAYIDRTYPEYTITTSYDSKLNKGDLEKWTNEPIVATVTAKDNTASDGSYSGIRSIEYMWTVESDPNKVWGTVDKNCTRPNESYKPITWCTANVTNVNDRGIKDKTYSGSSSGTATDKVPYYTYTNAPQTNSLQNHIYYSNSTAQTYKKADTQPAAEVLNDKLYLHVRVCDNSTTTNGKWAPHCVTGVYGPAYFDNIAPNPSDITVVNPPNDKTPVNPPTDPEDPLGGGTGSEPVDPGKVTSVNGLMNSHDWTNKLVIGVTVKETNKNSELGAGYRENSGIERIDFYYDTNYVHESTTNIQANYPSTPNNTRKQCNGEKVCSYYLDFNSLSSYPNTTNETPTVMEEGNRFIKINAVDVAGNVGTFYFGPYKWDITKNELYDIEFHGGNGTFIEN